MPVSLGVVLPFLDLSYGIFIAEGGFGAGQFMHNNKSINRSVNRHCLVRGLCKCRVWSAAQKGTEYVTRRDDDPLISE